MEGPGDGAVVFVEDNCLINYSTLCSAYPRIAVDSTIEKDRKTVSMCVMYFLACCEYCSVINLLWSLMSKLSTTF